jgi:hypothetical protein
VLPGAQAVVELSVRAEEGARVLEREGERCRVLRGWSLPFIVVGGASGRRARAVTGCG